MNCLSASIFLVLIVLTLILTVPVFDCLFRSMAGDFIVRVPQFHVVDGKTVMTYRRKIQWIAP